MKAVLLQIFTARRLLREAHAGHRGGAAKSTFLLLGDLLYHGPRNDLSCRLRTKAALLRC